MTTAWVVCDSDSYLKWGATRAAELRAANFEVTLLVVQNAVTPSRDQMSAALAGLAETPRVASFKDIKADLARLCPDVLLLACRGPMLELLASSVPDSPARPVIVTGIPGIWLPPTTKGLRYRRAADVFVVHSMREREAVAQRLPFGRIERVGIASLVSVAPQPTTGYHGHVVFAPQALVPRTASERTQLLEALIAMARQNPETPVIVKLRGRDDESQTHAEALPYPALARSLGVQLPDNFSFEYGALGDFLPHCRGLITVSSTAVIEAVSAKVPVLCVDDFGINESNINTVFEGSGFFASLEQAVRLEFPEPNSQWLHENYLHDAALDTWLDTVAYALAARERGELSAAASKRSGGVTGLLSGVRDRAIALGDADNLWRRAIAAVLRPFGRMWREVRGGDGR